MRAPCIWAVALLLVVAACGGDEDTRSVDDLLGVLRTGDDASVEEAVSELARRGRASPKTVVPDLANALRNHEGDRYVHTFEFRVDDPEASESERRVALTKFADMLPHRARDYSYIGSYDVRDDYVQMRIGRPSFDEAAMKRHIDNVVFRLSAPGTVALRLVVTNPASESDATSIWDGDAASFKAYAEAEGRRLAQSLKDHVPFIPTKPAYHTVVRHAGPQGGQPGILIVYDDPEPANDFEARDMEIRGAIDADSGEALVEITLDKTRVGHMRAWSERHHGREVAIVLNGGAIHTFRIGSVLGERTHLPIGKTDDPKVLDWLKALVTAARTGPYPARIVGRLLPPKPEYLDLPIARALVEVGAPAEAALREILREDGPMAPVARWALGELTRRATGQKKVEPQGR